MRSTGDDMKRLKEKDIKWIDAMDIRRMDSTTMEIGQYGKVFGCLEYVDGVFYCVEDEATDEGYERIIDHLSAKNEEFEERWSKVFELTEEASKDGKWSKKEKKSIMKSVEEVKPRRKK